MVEPTESGEVESGELRWPPDDLSPADDPRDKQAQAAGKLQHTRHTEYAKLHHRNKQVTGYEVTS